MRNLRYRAENVDFDFDSNGERRVLEVLAAGLGKQPTIFDVGANRGDWSRMALATFDRPQIHAFEAVPSTAATCQQRLSDAPSVRINAFGLSTAAESRVIFGHDDSADASASAFPVGDRQQHGYVVEHVCRFESGETYLAANNLDKVDFVKVDAEGMDLHVLRGFGPRLRDVRVIQFEYGVFNIGSRTLLKDFYDLLTPFGFEIGKVFPRGVDFDHYSFMEENFMGNNYVAARPGSPLHVALAGQFGRSSRGRAPI